MPERAMSKVAKLLASVLASRLSPAADVQRFQSSVLGEHVTASQLAIINRNWVEAFILDRLLLLRCHGFGGWQPKIDVSGIEVLEASLSTGRGALLWATPFRFNDLVTKMALAQNGYAYKQLSRFSHPGNKSAFGCTFLNPIRVNIENRYLAQRLVIQRDKRVDGRRTLDVLAENLKANDIVTITVGKAGNKTMSVPLLDDRIQLATGPAHLALRTGAPLLPVFTIQTNSDQFQVTIGAPLQVGDYQKESEKIEAILTDYATRLGPFLMKWPEQFSWNRFDAG
jgi:lauroyl/myristoyl acyltransferase